MVFLAIRTIAFFLSAGQAGMAGSQFAVPHYILKMLKDEEMASKNGLCCYTNFIICNLVLFPHRLDKRVSLMIYVLFFNVRTKSSKLFAEEVQCLFSVHRKVSTQTAS